MAKELHADSLQSFEDLSTGFEANREKTEEKRAFSKLVNDAMALTDPANPSKGAKSVAYLDKSGKLQHWSEEPQPFRYRNRKEKLAGLDAVLKSDAFEKAEAAEVMHLFSAYRELGAYDRMVKVYDEAQSKDFVEAPMVKEFLADALRRKKGSSSDDLKRSISICRELRSNGEASSLTYLTEGEAQLKLSGQTADAAEIFEAGFEKDKNPILGIKAVQANMNSDQKDKAKELAKVVYLAALRDGVEESKDFYTVSAALQAACIAGEKESVVRHLADRLDVCIKNPAQLQEMKANMAALKKAGVKTGVWEVGNKLADLSKNADKDARKGGVIVLGKPKDVRAVGKEGNESLSDRKTKLESVISHSYSYRGCGSDFHGTSRVGGNMEFGGQLPDHSISKKDFELFKGLLGKTASELGVSEEQIKKINERGKQQDRDFVPVTAETKLSDIKNPEMFMRVTDAFVRNTFQTADFAKSGLHMEENALAKNEKGESIYDATVKAFERGAGKLKKTEDGESFIRDKNIDTRTNISAIFALGLGDCRHHAQVKQIMFDMYQRVQMDAVISDLYKQVKEGNTVDLNGEKAKEFYDVLDTEVRTSDIQVRMPIIMQQKEAIKWVKEDGKWAERKAAGEDGTAMMQDKAYSPDLDDSGRYKVDPTGRLHNLEDHTLCWIVKKDREGNLQEFGMRDAFYQDKHYHWGHLDVNVDDIKIAKNGHPMIPAGVIPAEHTDKGIPLQVYQVPTVYNTGKRDTVETHSIGTDICFVGIRMSGFKDSDEFLKQINDREGKNKIMAKTLQNDPEKETKDNNYAPAKTYAPLPEPKTEQKPRGLHERISAKQELADQKRAEAQEKRNTAAKTALVSKLMGDRRLK